MKQQRDQTSGALIFNRTPAEDKTKKQNKLVFQLEKEIISLTKKIKTLQNKFVKLDKKVKTMEEKD